MKRVNKVYATHSHSFACPTCEAPARYECEGPDIHGAGQVHAARVIARKVHDVLDGSQHLALDNDRDRAALARELIAALTM